MRRALPALSCAAIAVLTSLACWSMPAAAAPAPAAKRTAALVLYGGHADDVDDALHDALGTLSTITLRDRASTEADVAAAREIGTSCTASNVECFVSLAVLLHVDVLVVARADAAPNGGTTIELIAVDANKAREIAREKSVTREGQAADVVDFIDVVQLLLEPERHFGTLTVKRPLESTLLIDEVVREQSVDVRVRAGRHHVVVSKNGFRPFRQTIQVAPGEDATVVVTSMQRLGDHSTAAPPTEPPRDDAAWIVAGVGLGVGAVGLGTAAVMSASLANGLGTFDDKDTLQRTGQVALIVGAAGAAFGVGAAVVALSSE